jgi:hypothetical protein
MPFFCCCTASQTRDIHNKVCVIPRAHCLLHVWLAGAGRSHRTQTEPAEQHSLAKCVVPTTHVSVCVCSALHTVMECSTKHDVGW